MDQLFSAAHSSTDIEHSIVSGWSALEHGDLEGARAALQEVYSADPTHPSLPLMAAAIRRARPKPVPWRAMLLGTAIVVAGVLGVRVWSRHLPPQPDSPPASTAANVAAVPPSTEPAPVAKPRETGTAGQIQQHPTLPTVKQNASALPMDEDVVVRQAIQRFEGAYTSRWGSLAFEHCDVSRELDHATATCSPRLAGGVSDAEPARVWTFALHKSDSGWKIASVQPPSTTPD